MRWMVPRLSVAALSLLLIHCECETEMPPDGGDPDGGEAMDAGPRDDSGRRSSCGNGTVEDPEECDDGNDSEDDDCLNDCTNACGDGVVQSTELCDTAIADGMPGACPISCDDSMACTSDSLNGSGCQVQCSHGEITACSGGDGCCPTGCNGLNDSDCPADCGNGVIEMGETCDPMTSCPTSCDDMMACTSDALGGDASTCDAACTFTPITACADADGCCPTGCDETMDDDCSPVCGNSVLETGETCDPPGSCPTGCDDMNACTADSLTGDASMCTAACVNAPITMCTGGDGCCPMGCDQTSDSDCSPVCGNMVIEMGETCDPPGSCPTSCDDMNACTADSLTGDPTMCTAACTNTPITACMGGDGCCPMGCDQTSDSDCSASCGNMVVEMGETCDPPSSCPTSCDDMNACTADSMSGSAANCNVTCTNSPITMCTGGDGCCPMGCNANTDSDCPAMCGNMVTEPGETCDPPSSCPTTCDDMNACTADSMSGSAATCDVACTNTPITTCTGGDGCCAPGCDATTDSDCAAVCGNMVLEPGETCDPPSSCPTSCDDMMACTADSMSGSAATCDVACTNTPITTCANGDGCCPAMCNAVVDDDCTAVCGNMVVEPGETCDDGNTTPGDGCDAMCQAEVPPTVFRMADLDIRDPHFFTTIFFFCSDITGNLNSELQNAITMDMDGDGLLDLSYLLIFRPLNQSVPGGGMVEFVEGDCDTAPMTSCDRTMGATSTVVSYTNQSMGTCLAPIAGTARASYTPVIATPTAPCFVTSAADITLTLSGINIPLFDAQLGATYVGSPATQLDNGLMRGFLRESDADSITLPASLPLVGGMRLSAVLRGGMGNCASGSDMDTHPTHGNGWWMYVNFPGVPVTYTGM